MNVQHILSEMQTLESGLTPHARCVFPHAVHTLGITNWMQCLVWRNVSPQIDSGAWRHFARAVTPTCRLSLCHGSFAPSAPPYLHRCSRGPLHANTAQTPSPQEYVEPGDMVDQPVRASVSWERVLLFQRKTSIIMHWLRGSCPRPTRGMERAGRKMY